MSDAASFIEWRARSMESLDLPVLMAPMITTIFFLVLVVIIFVVMVLVLATDGGDGGGAHVGPKPKLGVYF